MHYHLVHVGKCAGESVARAIIGVTSNLSIYHCGDAPERLADLILRPAPQDVFIVLMRNPIKRFISAFEWDLHSKSLNGDGETFKNPRWTKIYQTFRSANDLAEALSSANKARRIWAERSLSESGLHMQFDLGWYLPPVIANRLPEGRTHLIWTERIEDDTKAFFASQNLRPRAVNSSKDSYKQRLPEVRLTKALSPNAARNIRLASHASYTTMQVLIDRFGRADQISADDL